VRIKGATFAETVDLSYVRLRWPVWLDASEFKENLVIRYVQADAAFSLEGTRVKGDLDLSESSFARLVKLSGARIGRDLSAARASIGRQFAADNVTVGRKIDLSSMQVGAGAYLQGASATSLDASHARVGGQLDLSCARFVEALGMASVQTGDSLLMRRISVGESKPGTVLDLIYARIGGNLDLSDSALVERPSSALPVRGARARDECEQRPGAESRLPSVDLTGARIERALRLGSDQRRPPRWTPDAKLTLRNTTVRDLQDRLESGGKDQYDARDPWPAALDLAGFTYQNLGALGVSAASEMASRSSEWWLAWLGRHRQYVAQPYEQAGATLQRLGYPDKAKDILFGGRERGRVEASTSAVSKFWLTLHKLFIGYGLRTYYSLYWIAGFVLLGAAVLRLSGQGPKNRMPYGIFYSFDNLVPVVGLRKLHKDTEMRGWVRYYFYFHKAMGYVLTGFLIASLSGLTKY
jgi:hypothetical protein